MKHHSLFFAVILLHTIAHAQTVEIIFTNKTNIERQLTITTTRSIQAKAKPGFVSVPSTSFQFVTRTLQTPRRQTIAVESDHFAINNEIFSFNETNPNSTFLLFAAVQKNGSIRYRSPFNKIRKEGEIT